MDTRAVCRSDPGSPLDSTVNIEDVKWRGEVSGPVTFPDNSRASSPFRSLFFAGTEVSARIHLGQYSGHSMMIPGKNGAGLFPRVIPEGYTTNKEA